MMLDASVIVVWFDNEEERVNALYPYLADREVRTTRLSLAEAVSVLLRRGRTREEPLVT